MRTLKEMTREELEKLFRDNKEINNRAYEDAYGEALECQGWESDEIKTEVFDYHNHYNSFYLTTPTVYGSKCPEKVANQLQSDYLNTENAYLYTKLNNLIDKWERMTTDEQDTEEGEKIYDEATETCDKLAEGITKQLRAYEDITETDAIECFIQNASEGYMSDWEESDGKVYEHITRVYE